MPHRGQTRVKDGIAWRIGSERDVQWIGDGTGVGRQITAAIPAVFADYATLVHPGAAGVPRDVRRELHQDLALVELLRRHSPRQPWWLGYLDTGASDIVFWDASKVGLYTGWRYVLIEAGPEQAATWRPAPGGQSNWKSTELPDLVEDHAWLIRRYGTTIGARSAAPTYSSRISCRIVFSVRRRAGSRSAKTPRHQGTLRGRTRTSDVTAAPRTFSALTGPIRARSLPPRSRGRSEQTSCVNP